MTRSRRNNRALPLRYDVRLHRSPESGEDTVAVPKIDVETLSDAQWERVERGLLDRLDREDVIAGRRVTERHEVGTLPRGESASR
jgi:hypothetical protein